MVPSLAQVRLSYVNGGFKHKLSLSSYYGLCGEVQPERGFFFRLQEYQRGRDFIADDKRSTQSYSPGFYYACVACMKPAFVWTSTKNEWNAQNAL